jgi:hypothetical protein
MRDKMDAWPHISRPRAVRFTHVAGLVTLGAVAVYVVLWLAGGASSGPFSWVTAILLGCVGILELLAAWAARRDQARKDAATAQASLDRR